MMKVPLPFHLFVKLWIMENIYMNKKSFSLSDISSVVQQQTIFALSLSYGEFLALPGFTTKSLRKFMLTRHIKRLY